MKTFADINTSNITTYILMSQRLQLYKLKMDGNIVHPILSFLQDYENIDGKISFIFNSNRIPDS